MLAAVMLLAGCSTDTSGSERAGAAKASLSPSEFCALLPLTVGDGDVLTDRTAEDMLVINLLADSICP